MSVFLRFVKQSDATRPDRHELKIMIQRRSVQCSYLWSELMKRVKVKMESLCRQKTGLFPTPAEMKFNCSCPDSARMCKHIAAVLYGIGASLDETRTAFHASECRSAGFDHESQPRHGEVQNFETPRK